MIAACACIGWSRALRLAQRVEELERFRTFLQMLCTEIRFSAAPLASLIRQHAGESKWLQACAALLEQGTPFPQAWQRASQTAPVPKQDRMLLREFGEGLGVSDVEGQIAHCTLYAGKLEFLLRQARTEQTQKSKLYVTLGISAGAVLGLLVM